MTEPAISQNDIDTLFAKLDELELTEPQRALLEAILKVAMDVTELPRTPDHRSFSAQFAASFKQGQAERVVAYSSSPTLPPHMIVRGSWPSPGSATPGMIVRGTPTDPGSDPVPDNGNNENGDKNDSRDE